MPVMKQFRIGSATYDTVGEASVTQVQTSGTKIATVTIDGTATDLYAPEGGGSGPEPSSTMPSMDGTAAVGTATTYARADHVHPTDTSLVPKSSTSNGQTTQITNDGSSVHLVSEKNSNYADAQIGRNGNASVSLYASTTGSHTELIVNPTGVSIDNLVTPTTSTMPTTKQYVDDGLAAKQATLVSGTNIKTINGTSILGSGDITTPTYTLPTASTSTLGGVKVDGSTITIADGVISSSGGGGGGDAYVIGMTLSGTTVSNVTYPTGESATTIATAIMDDPSTRVVFSIDVGANHGVMNCTPCSLQASAYPAYGDEATSIDAVMPMWYEDRGGDRETYLLRLMLYGGNWSAQTRTTI